MWRTIVKKNKHTDCINCHKAFPHSHTHFKCGKKVKGQKHGINSTITVAPMNVGNTTLVWFRQYKQTFKKKNKNSTFNSLYTQMLI